MSSVIRPEVAAMFGALAPDVVDGIPETPDEEARSAGPWLMMAEAVDDGGRRTRSWGRAWTRTG